MCTSRSFAAAASAYHRRPSGDEKGNARAASYHLLVVITLRNLRIRLPVFCKFQKYLHKPAKLYRFVIAPTSALRGHTDLDLMEEMCITLLENKIIRDCRADVVATCSLLRVTRCSARERTHAPNTRNFVRAPETSRWIVPESLAAPRAPSVQPLLD